MFLDNYINKLKEEHIIKYAKNQNIKLANNESQIIYNFIKNNYKSLYENEYNEDLIKELKCKLTYNTYIKINMLYKEAKEKIRK